MSEHSTTTISALQPRLEHIMLPYDIGAYIKGARQELKAHALVEPDRCWAYYSDLPLLKPVDKSVEFAERLPEITVGEKAFGFSWIRYRLSGQSTAPAYHLDADTGIGLRGETDEDLLPKAEVWRLLMNLRKSTERRVGYIARDPRTLTLVKNGGAVMLADQAELRPGDAREIVIPPRDGQFVHAAVFCVSRVLHAGIENGDGHFLASWSHEVEGTYE